MQKLHKEISIWDKLNGVNRWLKLVEFENMTVFSYVRLTM